MKNFFYALYAFFFNLSRKIFPIKKNRVAFVAPHNGGENDSLGVMKKYIEQKGGFETVFITTNDIKFKASSPVRSIFKAIGFFTKGAKALATSEYIFLNDNFMPTAKLNFSPDAVITMLWHAEGAFKKFGLSAPLTDDIRKREKACSAKLDYIICSSENVADIYAEAFGTEKEKVLALGSPRVDKLLSKCDTEALRREFDLAHPECKNKKLVLYAPTFRDDPAADSALLSHIDTEKFNSVLGDEYSLLIKLHPQINSAAPVNGATDVTKEDIGMLTHICSAVITDYSSVCMDFALLSKPCIFFAFDLESYENERSFYFDYESYVPGKVVKTFDGVIEEIKEPRTSEEKLRKFRDFNFDYLDDNSTERIFNAVISSNSQ